MFILKGKLKSATWVWKVLLGPSVRAQDEGGDLIPSPCVPTQGLFAKLKSTRGFPAGPKQPGENPALLQHQ